MGTIIPEQLFRGIVFWLLLAFLLWLLLALLFGMILSWSWALRQLWLGQPLLPERPLVSRRPITWGWTPLLVLVVYVVGNVLAFVGYAVAAHGTAFSGIEKLSTTELMFVQAAINAVLLVLVPALIRLGAGARLRDLGLSFENWRRQVVVGIVAILITLPAVYAIQASVVRLLRLLGGEPHAHPVEKMLREQFSGGIAYLGLLSAVILAPPLEELLFRGILQNWLIALLARKAPSDSPGGPDCREPLPTAAIEGIDPGPWELEDPSAPASDAGAEPALANREADVQSLPARDSHEVPTPAPSLPSTKLAIILTSICFAAVHGPQWPAPIALFILALAFGTVYHRTGSLLAAICMHALFNGFSMLGLMIAMLVGGPADEAEKAIPPPAIERPAPIEGGNPRAVAGNGHMSTE